MDLRSGVCRGRKRVGAEEEVEDGCVVGLGKTGGGRKRWVAGCREWGVEKMKIFYLFFNLVYKLIIILIFKKY